jgi:hypothetical protein
LRDRMYFRRGCTFIPTMLCKPTARDRVFARERT